MAGRSVNHASPMNFSGDGGKGGGGGSGSTTAPPSSAFSSGKSFKKVVSNAQGAQTRVTGQNPNPNVILGSLNSSTGGKAVPNGCHIQPPLRGTPDASSTGVTVKPTDASVQKSSPGLPKARQSHAVTPISGITGATGPATPVKGDTSNAFPLQFGSISPGVMNGMQVPARTNSGPPIMDEQKRAQARLDSLEATTFTNPAVPKQQLPRKDVEPANVGLDDKWSKGPGPMVPGWDPRLGHGANHGVLRTPRGQPPGQYAGGILSGPMQPHGPQGGPMQRNNSDSDMWQRATGYQKGLMPSPHTPVMHKAERKYEVGKITDEEQAKQRQLKGILNKLTPQNFEKVFEQVKQVNIDNANTLSGVIGQIFDKALMEPTFVEIIANLCSQLSVELPDFSEDNEKITFKRLLLNKCQEEFERGVREQEEGEVKQTEEQREEKLVKARRRMLGNIRLIGELYKKKMLTERIMHECIKKLSGQYQDPDEDDIESLCILMSTIGEMIDHPKAKEHMDAYFDFMYTLSNNMQLSSRVRFMLKDAIDLRKNKWQQRRKYEVGKITDEEQAKQRQLKGIINKLTPQNFKKLFEQVKQVNIDNANTLSGVIGQIFDKDLMEPTFVEMYANFFSQLSVELPDFSEDNEKITLKRLLLNKCQDEIERGVREQEEGEVKQTEEQREEKLVKARRRMLGNIRLIGEIYKKKMLTERIMHECIKKLFGQYQDPDEEDIESLCILMSTIGEMIDHPKAKEHMDAYFDIMYKLSNNMQLSSRVRFKLKDAIDLRKNKWQQRRKYEVGKITDEEQAKQRQLKGIINKLTPQNFKKLFEQVKQVNIDNANTLSGVIGQIFDKDLMEPTFVEMYANFFSQLSVELPDFSEDNEKITFKRLLLNKCQEEFERGVREQEGEVKQTEEQREEKLVKARRRMLGNIRLIGELYKKKMLTERIMHECIKKLFGQYQDPDEEVIESLCILMSTIGEMIDHPKAKEHMDVYFDIMYKLSNNMQLSSRVRFMLKDAIDLRKNKWQQRRKVKGPKKIDEVHRDAAQERQAQSSRLARGPNSNPSIRREGQMDFGPKLSNVFPSNPQMGGFRGLPQQQLRGYGNQDPRFDSFENRTSSVPLRPMGGDDSITLGPQGGLARGMSVIGQPSMQGMPLHDMDSRRGFCGPNGYGAILESPSYGPRDDLGSRYMSDRFSPRPVYDPSSIQEHNMNNVNRDTRNTGRGFDLVPPFSPPERTLVSAPPQSGPSDKVLSEDHLRNMSIAAIKEFYGVRDEKEVALCIKDLNAPSFYPTMISIWVTDSFERKDMDQDALAKLLINLAKSHDRILSQDSFVKGFESVLSTLEDAVNDAPKAAEFLGRMFARILLENVVPYEEVWRLIYEGGEEQGQLVEVGLAAEVLGVILEIIKSEKGDPLLKDLRENSNPRLENFRSPTMKKTSRLDKFI